jgi:hypothetical protein
MHAHEIQAHVPGVIGTQNCQVALSAKKRNATPATIKCRVAREMHACEIHAIRCTLMMYTLLRCMSMRCMPITYTPVRYTQ